MSVTCTDIPQIAITHEEEPEPNDEIEHPDLTEVLTDIEDLDEADKNVSVVRNCSLKIILNSDVCNTDVEDIENSDDSPENEGLPSYYPTVGIANMDLSEETIEESFNINLKIKDGKEIKTVQKCGFVGTKFKVGNNYTEEELFDTDNELQQNDAPTSFDFNSDDTGFVDIKESNKLTLQDVSKVNYLSINSLSPNLSDLTDVEILDSDADDNFESKVLKYKRKKRRNVSKAITDTEDLDLSDDEITTRNRHKRNHKKSSIPKTVSLNFDREDEECVFSTNNIKEKRKVVNNSEFDSKDFCSDTDDFVSLMGEITDFCSQVKDAGSNIKRFDSDIETSEELEELEDVNGISTPPEKVKPPLVRNLTIFSEKNGVPTVTIFPLEDDHIEDDFTVDNIPTEEESISDTEEFSENYGSTVNPETDLIKSKKRKPPTFKSLYEKQNKLFMKETPIANIVDTEDIFVDEIKTDDFEMKTVYSMKKISNENKIVDEEIEKASNINQNENVHNEESDFKVSSQQEDDKEEKGDSEAISNSQECNEIEEAEEATDTGNLDESDVCRQTNSESYGNECGIRDDSSVQNVESSTEEWETQQKDELRSNKSEENAEKTDNQEVSTKAPEVSSTSSVKVEGEEASDKEELEKKTMDKQQE